MRSELVLHIGAPKTGTTALQHFLSVEKTALRHAGCKAVFLFTPSSRQFAELFGCLDKDEHYFRRHGLDSAFHVVRHFGRRIPAICIRLAFSSLLSRKTIISSEHLFLRLTSTRQIGDLHRFLKRFFKRIHVVIYLREKNDFEQALYWEELKAGSEQSLQEFQENLPDHLNIDAAVDTWSEVFGTRNVTAIEYRKEMNVPHDFIVNVLGAKPQHLRELGAVDSNRRFNPTPTADVFERVRDFNQSNPEFDQDGDLVLETRKARELLISQLLER